MGSCGTIEVKNEGHEIRARRRSDDYIPPTKNEDILPNSLAKKCNIRNFYKLSENKIGSGATGYVCIGERDNKKYAIKRMAKNKIRNANLKINEAEISLKANHKNIVKCHEFYEDKDYISCVMDLEKGGDLLDYITKNPIGHLTEDVCLDLFTQLCEVVNYLHTELKVIHRDLKPENIIVNIDENGKIQLKLIDFGSAAYIPINEEESLKNILGTTNYEAPEILEYVGYREKVDEWALGVLLFNMLTGKQPFKDENPFKLKENIKFAEIKFEKIKNEDFKNLDMLLLERVVNKRITAKECLDLIKNFKQVNTTSKESIPKSITTNNKLSFDLAEVKTNNTTVIQ